MVLFAFVGVKLRNQTDTNLTLSSEFLSIDSVRQRRFIVLRTAIIIHIFIIIFSTTGVLNYYTLDSGAINVSGMSFFYVVSFTYIYLSVEYYLGFPYKRIADKIEEDRLKKSISWGTVFLIPGLVFSSTVLGFSFFVFYVTYFGVSVDTLRSLMMKLYALAFFLVWFSHFRINFPRSSGIVENSRLVINGVLIFGLAAIPYAPFMWNVGFVSDEYKSLVGGLMVFGSVFTTLSFIYLLKVSWRIPFTILLIVCVFIIADKVLSFFVSLVPV